MRWKGWLAAPWAMCREDGNDAWRLRDERWTALITVCLSCSDDSSGGRWEEERDCRTLHCRPCFRGKCTARAAPRVENRGGGGTRTLIGRFFVVNAHKLNAKVREVWKDESPSPPLAFGAAPDVQCRNVFCIFVLCILYSKFQTFYQKWIEVEQCFNWKYKDR